MDLFSSAPEKSPEEFDKIRSSPLHSDLFSQVRVPSDGPDHKPESYLDLAIDKAASQVVSDTELRNDITHYTGEFVKTAALFGRGKTALAAAAIGYGLDEAKPGTSGGEQLLDFSLGTTKGLTMKAIFSHVAGTNQFSAAKGVYMGMGARATDIAFDKNSYADPSWGAMRVRHELLNPELIAFDAATFVVAEGLFGSANKLTSGALGRSKTGAGMFMGGSFGFVNGGSSELIRQNAEGESIDIVKILKHGALDGTVGALGAGAGIKASDPAFHSRVRTLISRTPAQADAPPPRLDMQNASEKTYLERAGLRIVGASLKANTHSIVGLSETVPLQRPIITINAMAPLLVGNQAKPEGRLERQAWDNFKRDLDRGRELGIEAVSTDVWWGKVEPKPGEFNWNYYDLMSRTLRQHGMKWVPIQAFHQCGGNVGDTVFQPTPLWIWSMAQQRAGSRNPDFAKFKSEQGNVSSEAVDIWAAPLVMDRFGNVMREFQTRYADQAWNIPEINVSLGPAGELRYPSYNSHDSGAGYPTRGALQAYSDPARASLRNWAIEKYGSEQGVREAWGAEFGDGIAPIREPAKFFAEGKHFNTQYGRDFFDWYSDSLLSHGRRMIGEASSIFAADNAPFRGIDLGVKMPGVHWRVGEWQNGQVVLGDRQAELAAGLIRTSRGDWGSDAAGRGYRPIVEMLAQSQPTNSRLVPHFTALEMPDGHEGPSIKSMPHTLSRWVGQEATRHGLMMKAENALNYTIYDRGSWDRMRSVLATPGNQTGYYHGLTLLRLSDVIESQVATQQVQDLLRMTKELSGQKASGQ